MSDDNVRVLYVRCDKCGHKQKRSISDVCLVCETPVNNEEPKPNKDVETYRNK